MARKDASKLIVKGKRKSSWAAIGIDTSYSALAGAAVIYDGLLEQLKGPSTLIRRWNEGQDYLTRMAEAARAEDIVHELLGELGIVTDIGNIYIAVEEPWPAHSGFVKRMKSAWLLQQAEMCGAFRGGLARYGYQNIYQVGVKQWRSVVAAELEIKQDKAFDKWTVKQWALDAFDIPDWPDLINSPHGKIPRPEKSKAKGVQPDDRYDALGIMSYMQMLVEDQLGAG